MHMYVAAYIFQLEPYFLAKETALPKLYCTTVTIMVHFSLITAPRSMQNDSVQD